MKVLQLNVWTGRLKGALTRFLREHDYDIICLQEAVWSEADAFLGHHVDTVEDLKKAAGLEYDARVSNWGIDLLGGSATMEQGNVILSRYPIIEVEKKLRQMAEAKYVEEGCARALDKIDNMDVADVKRYLKELIKDNMTVGIEIIKSH